MVVADDATIRPDLAGRCVQPEGNDVTRLSRVRSDSTEAVSARGRSRAVAGRRDSAGTPGTGPKSGYPVIATRLYPRLRQAPVSRETLLGRLDEARTVPLTLVVAPTGWGKSTPVAQWLDRASASPGWVCVDRADNDPHRFWRNLLLAVAINADAEPANDPTMSPRSSPAMHRPTGERHSGPPTACSRSSYRIRQYNRWRPPIDRQSTTARQPLPAPETSRVRALRDENIVRPLGFGTGRDRLFRSDRCSPRPYRFVTSLVA
jgi:hypothetical protein